MSYIGRSAKLSRKTQEKVSFLATAGQTVATGLAYVPTFVEVILNGSTLTDVTDYTATDGNSITFLGDPLTLNDEVTIISLKTFALADHYNKSEADALLAAKAALASPSFTGGIDVTGTVTADGLSIAEGSNLSLDGGGDTYIDSPAANEIRMVTGGVARVRVDDAGNVGIGTSSPSESIHIVSTIPAITLEDTSGDSFQMSNNNGKWRVRNNTDSRDDLTITGGGNVGIGTSFPTEALHISSGGLLIDSYIPNAPASGTSGFIADYAGTNARLWSRGNATTRGGFEFKSLESDGGNQIDAMRIDSAGIVTKPYQPAFHVYDNGGGLAVQTTTTIVPFSVAELNTGNHFNFSTNQFNAPVSGMYCFSGHAYFYASTDYNRMFIKVNSGTKGYLIEGANSESHTSIVSTTCYLNAGDTAQMELQSNDGNIYYRSSIHTYFTGHLIG